MCSPRRRSLVIHNIGKYGQHKFPMDCAMVFPWSPAVYKSLLESIHILLSLGPDLGTDAFYRECGEGWGTEPLNTPSCSPPHVTSDGCSTLQSFSSQGEADPRLSLTETSDLRAFCAVVREARDCAAQSLTLTHLIDGLHFHLVHKTETSSPLISPKRGSGLIHGLPDPLSILSPSSFFGNPSILPPALCLLPCTHVCVRACLHVCVRVCTCV